MWFDPPNRLNTLPFAPWLSQTTAGGQRSGLAFLCPNPPWVPTYPLSRGSPSAVTHATSACSIFLSISVFSPPHLTNLALLLQATVSHFIPLCYFFHSFLCLLALFCSFATVIFGQQLSWRAWKGSNPPLPFPAPSVSPSFSPSIPPSLSCALPWHWRDQFTQQQLRQASFVLGLPPEKAFFTSGDLLTAYGDIECLIALPPNLAFLFFSGSLSCWTWCTLGLRCDAFL